MSLSAVSRFARLWDKNTALIDACPTEVVNRLGKANALKLGRKSILTHYQQREAVKGRDRDGETLRSIARSLLQQPEVRRRLGATPPLLATSQRSPWP